MAGRVAGRRGAGAPPAETSERAQGESQAVAGLGPRRPRRAKVCRASRRPSRSWGPAGRDERKCEGRTVSSRQILLYYPLLLPRRRAMLGDIVELTVVVRDLDAAVERFTRLFGLKVHHRAESREFGFKNAILPTGIGHIELLQPTDPDKPVGRFLAKHGEGVYLVGFECQDIPGSGERLKKAGLFVELRKRETYA